MIGTADENIPEERTPSDPPGCMFMLRYTQGNQASIRRMGTCSRLARKAARRIFTASPGRKGSTHQVRLVHRGVPVSTMNQTVPNT